MGNVLLHLGTLLPLQYWGVAAEKGIMNISQESPRLGYRLHPLFLLVVGPHLGSQSDDFIAHKTMFRESNKIWYTIAQ